MLLQSLVTSIHQQWRIIHPEALGSLDEINLRKSQAYLTLLLQRLWGTILPFVLYSVFKKWWEKMCSSIARNEAGVTRAFSSCF